ncbi:hypothetical protein [Thalassoroseus pseudoceratinae]|uniref:hypothetical protein n=1 Tax=Thalassoroseus pseudoceratinae TaxID=2713176 RepID=UPI0014244A2C|nr:hypothetical protein [Thalassoroseus pseudoceratinae]
MIRRVCWGLTFVLGSLVTWPVAAQTEADPNTTPPQNAPTPPTQIVQTQSFVVEYIIVGGLAGLALFAVCKSSRRV